MISLLDYKFQRLITNYEQSVCIEGISESLF